MEIRRVLQSEIPISEIEPFGKDSFFSSPGFLNLWKEHGGSPVWWTTRLDNSLVAALPGVEFGVGILKRFHATPNGCYGKLCFSDGLDRDVRQAISRQMMWAIGNAGYIKTFVNDFYNCFDTHEGFTGRAHRTRLVDISDTGWEPPSKQVRKDIRAAEKAGVILRPFDADIDFADFLRLVTLSQERLGADQKYSPAFYRALAELSNRDDRVRWVWCEHEGKPVASSIFLAEGEHLLSWQVYYDASQSRFQATKLARFQTARYMAKKGVKYLNLGVSHEGASGTEEFKRRWGGEEYEYISYERKSFLGRLL